MAEKLRLRAPNVWAQARPTIATLDNANPGVTASNACADLARLNLSGAEITKADLIPAGTAGWVSPMSQACIVFQGDPRSEDIAWGLTESSLPGPQGRARTK